MRKKRRRMRRARKMRRARRRIDFDWHSINENADSSENRENSRLRNVNGA